MINWKTISLRDLAGFISERLREAGIDTVLVGGACVTIYSKNRYQSYDLDYVTYEDMKQVKIVLKKIGFIEKQKYFKHKDCPWLIEFVAPPVSIGNEPIQKFNQLKTSLGTIKLLFPIDSVRDRLASFYHWNDKEGLEQAIEICLQQEIDLKKVEKWSIKEGYEEKYQIFKQCLLQK